MVINTGKGKGKSKKKFKHQSPSLNTKVKPAKKALKVRKKKSVLVYKGRWIISPIARRVLKKKKSLPYAKIFKHLKIPLIFTTFKNIKLLGMFRIHQLNLLAYVTLYKLFIDKFLSTSKISKFIGKSQLQRRKKRKRWSKVIKIKAPYFYMNKARRSSLATTYTKLKLYRLFWNNNEVFQTSTLAFIKRYAVFGKRSKMLKNILKHVIRKSKKKTSLAKYRYAQFMNNYSFKKNFSVGTVSGMFLGIKSELSKARKKWKRQKRRQVNSIHFRKFFFKTLIEGRSLVKLVLRKKFKRKRALSNTISASTHTTFFTRLHKLEFNLFNLVLRSRFTTSLKDALLWIKEGLIFVNNVPTANPYLELKLGDRIQLALTNRYFLYKKTYFSKNKKDVAKLRAKLWLKNKGKFNLFRKRSKHWPKWIMRTTYYKALVPNFLEVDYLTLTSVIVCLPKTIMEYDSVLWRYLNIYNFRLYNWKITN